MLSVPLSEREKKRHDCKQVLSLAEVSIRQRGPALSQPAFAELSGGKARRGSCGSRLEKPK